MRGCVVRAVVSLALVVGVLGVVPDAGARNGVTLTLEVTFLLDGSVTVALPDGTPVGATSGAPTVIPGGYYTVLMAGPGGCASLPLFELKGPGADLFADMTGGELNYDSRNIFLAPNSTYTWRNFGTPGVVHTFVTSASVLGTPPVPSGAAAASRPGKTVSSQDVVGSGLMPFRGKLTGAVSSSGRLTLAFAGKRVYRLRVGRYTLTVADRSPTAGFVLQKPSRKTVPVTDAVFRGQRTVSLSLTAGKWLFVPTPGAQGHPLVVS